MIKFPAMHIAASVQNRILNLAQRIPADPPTGESRAPLSPPMGQFIDQAVTTPPLPMEAPDGAENVAVANTLAGGTAADAVTTQSLVGELS